MIVFAIDLRLDSIQTKFVGKQSLFLFEAYSIQIHANNIFIKDQKVIRLELTSNMAYVSGMCSTWCSIVIGLCELWLSD